MGKKALFLLLIITLCGCSSGTSEEQEDPRYQSVDTLPMLIMQIQNCSRLYTSEYHIHKIVTHDDELALKGSLLKQNINIPMPMGRRKIAIPMDATIKAYIDFAQFSEKNIERHGEKIILFLPDPQIEMTSSKINQKAIKSYVGLTRAHFTDEEMTHYEKQGRKAILDNANKMGIVETSRQSAARTLIPLLKQLGYQEQDITITFRKDMQGYDIRQLLDRSTIEKK